MRGAAKYLASQRLLVASSIVFTICLGVVASLYSLEALSPLILLESESLQEPSLTSWFNLRCQVSILKQVDRSDLSEVQPQLMIGQCCVTSWS